MVDIATLPDEKIVALTLWGEIRGGSSAQKLNVANVIRNRVRATLRREGDNRPDWWGEGWRGVCLARAQFSCWFDAQRERMLTLPETDRQYQACLGIARRVMAGRDPDPTNGATHYHTIARPEGVTTWPPAWGDVLRNETIRDGAHVFYRDPRARYPEDAIAAAAAATPSSNTGPATAAGTAGGGAVVTALANMSPEQATGWLGFMRPLVQFVNENWFLLTMTILGVLFALACVWQYRRWQSRKAVKA